MNSVWSLILASSMALSFSTVAVAQSHASAHTAATGTPAAGPVSEAVTASHCWIRHMPPPTASGGFFVLHNAGSRAATLEAARSADYGMIMLHQTQQVDGVSKMAMVDRVDIPAGGELAFKPGSYHLMLEQPRAALQVGDDVDLDLILAGGDIVRASCELKSPASLPVADDHDHSSH